MAHNPCVTLVCEDVQDCVGPMLTGRGFVYDDTGNQWDTTGTSGQVLSADGAGGATWVSISGAFISAVADTSCMDLTVSAGTLSATPIISATAGNQVACTAGGLFVPALAGLTVTDTTCIDLTLTGTALSAAPIISATAGNSITCTATGLYVANLCTQLQGIGAAAAAAGDTILALNGTTCKRITPNFTVISNGAGSVSQTIDFGNTLNINGAGLATVVSSATDTVTVTVLCEDVQDCVGPMLTGRGFVYDDAGNQWDTTGTAGQVLSADGAGGATWISVGGAFISAIADTTCIDLTVTAGTLTAAPIISAAAGNQITCTAGGLFVPALAGLTVTDTTCIDLTLTGTALSAAPIISATAGNSITCTATGLYVANLCTQLQGIAAGAPAVGDTILALNGTTCKRITPNFTVLSNGAGSVSQTIDFGNTLNINGAGLATVVSSATDTVTVTVLCEDVQDCVGTMLSTVGFVYNDAANRFDVGGTNGQVLTSNGAGGATWTTVAAGGGFITAIADTTCIDLTVTGTTLSAAPIISAAAGNQITCTAGGLFVPALAGLTVTDTTCIDLTLTGTALSAAPIISATAGNSITCTATGLYVANLCTQLQGIATAAGVAGDTILALNGTTCKRVTICDLLRVIPLGATNDSTTDKMLVVDPTNNECKLAPTPLMYRSQCLGCTMSVSTFPTQMRHIVACGTEEVTAVAVTAGTAPVGANLVINIMNGGTILKTVTLPAGSSTVIDNADFSIPNGAVITLNVTQVGSTTAGANVCVEFWYRVVGGTC